MSDHTLNGHDILGMPVTAAPLPAPVDPQTDGPIATTGIADPSPPAVDPTEGGDPDVGDPKYASGPPGMNVAGIDTSDGFDALGDGFDPLGNGFEMPAPADGLLDPPGADLLEGPLSDDDLDGVDDTVQGSGWHHG